MRRLSRLIWITVFVAVPACRNDDGLGRIEVRGRVSYQGAPIQRGLITFRPASGLKGPVAGTVIIDGKFSIPAEKGPIAGPHEVEVKIVNVDNGSVKSAEPALSKREPGQLISFSRQVEVTKGVKEFESSFPISQPPAGKNTVP
jgi:hypothetical protein